MGTQSTWGYNSSTPNTPHKATSVAMGFVKKAASSMGGSSENKDNNKSDNKSQQKDDYGDKAFSALNDKAGWGMSKENQEKITDGAREGYEKYSGSQVPEKYSN